MFLATTLILLGIALGTLGALLLSQGGSSYYPMAGITLIVSGYWLFKRQAKGALLYLILFIGTVVWTFYEAGLHAWSHLPRLGLFAALGLWFLLPRTRRRLGLSGQPLPRRRSTRVGGLLVIAYVAALFVGNQNSAALPATALNSVPAHRPGGDWAHYGATQRGTRYTPHEQINRNNIAKLEVAWQSRTAVPGTFKGTPIQVGSNLLLCTGMNIVISLDPDSGAERWRYDPQVDNLDIKYFDTCRGVTYYKPEPATDICPERVYTATLDARLIALDVATGKPCADFGDDGQINLLEGLGEVKPAYYFATSPPAVARGTLVLGGGINDNEELDEPSGVVRGFDPISGELRWAWDMGREDRRGLPAEGESYTRGTPNVWSLISADDELGLVYVPTGNATPDLVGMHRAAAMEKYASSVVALEADTGQVRWHFQTVRHDLWDYDVPAQPTLADISIDGQMRKALILPTKRAEIFVLDRETGEPLTEVVQKPTPQTDIPEETTAATQPFSTGFPHFRLFEPVREADTWGITPIDHLLCRIKFTSLQYEGHLTPPSLKGSLYYPGVAGGMNWGGTAIDEVNQLLVINNLHMPSIGQLIPREEADRDPPVYFSGGPQHGTPYAARLSFFLSPIFTPCLRPPYGEMAVVDMSTQKVLWRRSVGTSKDMGPLGIPSMLPLPMGMFYQAGSMVSAGGLIFNAGILDSTLRAIDVLTGKELWSDDLPGSSEATPMSYVSPVTGYQYLIVTVPHGGPILWRRASGGDSPTDESSPGGYVIAYRLPDVALGRVQ